MDKNRSFITIYGVLLNNQVYEALLKYYDDYEDIYEFENKDEMFEYFNCKKIHFNGDEFHLYLGKHISSIKFPLINTGPLKYEELQNSVKEVSEDWKEDVKKMIYHLTESLKKDFNLIQGYYQVWI